MTFYQKIREIIERADMFSIERMRFAAIVLGVLVFGITLRGVMFSSEAKTAMLAAAQPGVARTAEVVAAGELISAVTILESGNGGDGDAAALASEDMFDIASLKSHTEGDADNIPIIVSVQPPVSDSHIPALSAEAYIVARGTIPVEVTHEKNSRVRRAPASLTKLMTATIVAEMIPDDEIVTITENAVATEGVAGYMRAGERFRAADLMKMMLIVSSNDAAVAFEDHVKEKGDDLIVRMNEKARELGMNETHFENPSGLDHNGHYSTAFDLSLLASYSLRHEKIWEALLKKADTVYAVGENTPHHLFSNNPIVQKKISGVKGSKTGFTEQAGESMITAMDDGVVIVVLGSKNRAQDTNRLIGEVRNK